MAKILSQAYTFILQLYKDYYVNTNGGNDSSARKGSLQKAWRTFMNAAQLASSNQDGALRIVDGSTAVGDSDIASDIPAVNVIADNNTVFQIQGNGQLFDVLPSGETDIYWLIDRLETIDPTVPFLWSEPGSGTLASYFLKFNDAKTNVGSNYFIDQFFLRLSGNNYISVDRLNGRWANLSPTTNSRTFVNIGNAYFENDGQWLRNFYNGNNFSFSVKVGNGTFVNSGAGIDSRLGGFQASESDISYSFDNLRITDDRNGPDTSLFGTYNPSGGVFTGNQSGYFAVLSQTLNSRLLFEAKNVYSEKILFHNQGNSSSELTGSIVRVKASGYFKNSRAIDIKNQGGAQRIILELDIVCEQSHCVTITNQGTGVLANEIIITGRIETLSATAPVLAINTDNVTIRDCMLISGGGPVIDDNGAGTTVTASNVTYVGGAPVGTVTIVNPTAL